MSEKSKIKSLALKLIKSIICFILVAIVAMEAPFVHKNYLRGIAEENSVRIVGLDGRGSGFHVKTKSGKVYILTNKHICDMQGPLKVERYGSKVGIERKIIKKYEKHDLCIMEALPGATGISISSAKLENGDRAYTLGNPRGDNLNVAEGEKFDDKFIQLAESTKEDGTCAEGKVTSVMSFFGPITFCVIDRFAVQISNPTYPGNSGSAVVNKWGKLVAVIFAGSTQVENQGFAVPLEEINSFLNSLE